MNSTLSDDEGGQYFIIFDCFVAGLALVANYFALVALVQSTAFSKQAFYRYFLLSLITADIYVTLVNSAAHLYQLLSSQHYSTIGKGDYRELIVTCSANVFRNLRLAGFFANVMSICGMSFNYFVGMVYPGQYKQLLTRRKAKTSVISVWAISFLLAAVDIPVNYRLYQNYVDKYESILKELSSLDVFGKVTTNYSSFSEFPGYEDGNRSMNLTHYRLKEMLDRLRIEQIARDHLEENVCTFYSPGKMWFESCVMALVFLSAVILVVCYGIIIRKIVQSPNLLPYHAPGNTRIPRAVITAVMLVVAFLICWLPFMIFEVVMLLSLNNIGTAAKVFTAQQVLNSNLMMYPLVDALIYSVRIPALRRQIFQGLLKVSPCCRGRRGSRNGTMANSGLLEMAPTNVASFSNGVKEAY